MRIGAADDIAGIVRAARGDAVTLVIDEEGEPLALAQALASIGPLAMERAPEMRVNAVIVRADAVEGEISAAVAFLDSARSTTGQILWVGSSG